MAKGQAPEVAGDTALLGDGLAQTLIVPGDTETILSHGVSQLSRDGHTIRFSPEATLPGDIGDMRNFAHIWSASLLLAGHPVIGSAVMGHSRLNRPEGNVWQRISSSSRLISQITTSDDAVAAGHHIRDLHVGITGVDSSGKEVSALHREPYSWGWKGIMWMSQQTIRNMRDPGRSDEQMQRWWDEARIAYQAQGVSDHEIPDSYAGFEADIDDFCENRIERTPAIELAIDTIEAGKIDRPTQIPPPLWRSSLRKLITGHVGLLAYGGLPEAARERLGISWSEADQAALEPITRTINQIWKSLPDRMRYESGTARFLYPPTNQLQETQLGLNSWATQLYIGRPDSVE